MLKKWTKAEDATTAASQKKRRRTLLQTYLVSLMSLCLSVSMLLGTTMAWFTSTVDVPQNEIYVGTLKVDFQLMSDTMTADENGQPQGTSLMPAENGDQTKVFDDEIIWQAGHVEVRTFKIIDNGEIPFTYCLSLTAAQKDGQNQLPLVMMPDPLDPTKTIEADNSADFLKFFEVYTKTGDAVGFQGGDLLNASEWTLVGTLDQLVSEETVENVTTRKIVDLEVFRGDRKNMTEALDQDNNPLPPSALHTVVIKMRDDAGSDFGGYQLNFGIKLVANQMGTPEAVVDADKLAELLKNGYSVKISNDIELENSLSLNGNLLNGQVPPENAGEDDKRSELKIGTDMAEAPAIITTGGTVRYVTIMGADYTKSVAIATGNQKLNQNLYIDHVTIDKVATALQIVGNGQSKVQVTNSTISGAINCTAVSSLEFVTCNLGNTAEAYGSMIVGSNVTFTDCKFTTGEFKLIPEEATGNNGTEKIVVTFDNCTIDSVKVTDKNLLAQLGVGENFSDRYSFVFVNDNAN